MKRMLLMLLLVDSLNLTAQDLFNHQKNGLTAQQDSIVASFVANASKSKMCIFVVVDIVMLMSLILH